MASAWSGLRLVQFTSENGICHFSEADCTCPRCEAILGDVIDVPKAHHITPN